MENEEELLNDLYSQMVFATEPLGGDGMFLLRYSLLQLAFAHGYEPALVTCAYLKDDTLSYFINKDLIRGEEDKGVVDAFEERLLPISKNVTRFLACESIRQRGLFPEINGRLDYVYLLAAFLIQGEQPTKKDLRQILLTRVIVEAKRRASAMRAKMNNQMKGVDLEQLYDEMFA